LEDFTIMAEHVLPEGHPLTQTFLRRLEFIKRALSDSPAERAALISKLRANVESLLQVFNPNSGMYTELKLLAEQGNPAAQELIKRVDQAAITPALQDSLRAIARRVDVTTDALRNEVDQFGHEVEKWFDRGMERATGVYKRNAKAVAVIIGVATAISINADSFHIATRLAKDPMLRNSITQVADQVATNSQGELSENLVQVQAAVDQALEEIPFPLGYNEVVIKQQLEAERSWPIPFVPRRFLGWLVSGFAISMGSTFWFNVLRKVVDIRNSGGNKEG
jgi:hypothetical protein